MKVKEIMTKKVISVDKDIDLNQVLNLMKKHEITKIPVLENKKIIGIITDNTIAYKLGSIRKKQVSTSRLHASSVTEKNIEKVTPDTHIGEILKKVGEPGPTILPIVENNKLLGVITKADLLPLVNSKTTLRSIMRKDVHTVAPDDRIVHARRIMIDENVARLPVVEQGRLVGIISDMEIAFSFAMLKKSYSVGKQKHRLDELLVKDSMKIPIFWTTPNVSASEAAKIMIKHNVGALPIIENNTIIGIVSRTDLLKTISV